MAALTTEQSRVELFYEASRCDGPAMEAQLAAAGFDDITWIENLVLLGSYLRRHAELDLPRELELGSEATEELTGTLIQRGYLGPDGVTDRGRRALSSTMVIVRADRWKALRFRPDDIVSRPRSRAERPGCR